MVGRPDVAPVGTHRRRRLPRLHGRPWSGAFNVVMATAIVSIACREAGLELASIALLWLAVIAFAPLAVLDSARARHPLALLHLASRPQHGFAAFGFVADTCVLGARLVDAGAAARAICFVLLAGGAIVWLAIVVSLAWSRAGGSVQRASGEWLLAIVSTEGLAILAGRLAADADGGALHSVGVSLWLFGGAGYILALVVLAIRLRRTPLTPQGLTPDWWIVMGAPAIVAVAGVTVGDPAPGSPSAILVLAACGLAGVALLAILAGEVWRALELGAPTFTPARWTMVFPLGMYSTASQLAGTALGIAWLREFGRLWAIVALAAWLLVAAGELHHPFVRGPTVARPPS